MKPLPIGIQDFAKIREDGWLYVDKTPQLYNLVQRGGIYFLSRPRRFGKTLLLSTLEYLYEGRRNLFEGLWIYDHWAQTSAGWEAETRPVIRLDFNLIMSDPGRLQKDLISFMGELGKDHGLALEAETPKLRLTELIKALAQRSGKKVVVLVDEYDKPLTEYLDNMALAQENRAILKTFYSGLKGAEKHMHLLLLTGVSKYGKLSVFSDLNNPQDITLDPKHNALVGYTLEEMRRDLGEWIQDWGQRNHMTPEQTLAVMRSYYNGYSWDGRGLVFNPWSVHNALNDGDIRSYWHSTGTPSMLVKMLKQQKQPISGLERVEDTVALMDKTNLESASIYALLWQTGYLTIKEKGQGLEGADVVLGFPNQEVRTGFLDTYLAELAGNSVDSPNMMRWQRHFAKTLPSGNVTEFMEYLQKLFALIPYHLHHSTEAYMHAIVLVATKLSGLEVQSEPTMATGRPDMVLETEDAFYIVEFKNSTAAEALAQIKAKGYATAYGQEGKAVMGIGVAFDHQARNIAAWQTEQLTGQQATQTNAPQPSPEALQIARNLKAAGITMEQIQQFTGLSAQQLAHL